jgi:putative two-component system response regulator
MSFGSETTGLGLTGLWEATTVYPGATALTAQTPFMSPRPTDEAARNASIVIVDNDPAVATIVQRHLQSVGFRNFRVITDSSKAHSEIATNLPDIVLLDLHMHPVSGWELLESLRCDDRTQHIPLLILTSDTNEETRIAAYNYGAHDFLSKPIVVSELIARVRNTLAAKVYRDRMTQYSLQLEFDVLTDSLTGIANRRAFDYELRRRLVDWNRQRNPMCLMMIDVDHFKMANDRYGHTAGDAALIEIGGVLKNSVRELDLVARYGGEEFAVILPYSTIKDGILVAERAREAIADHNIHCRSQQFRVTVSIGIAEVCEGEDSEMLIRRADAALYRSKSNGRNRTYYCTGNAFEPAITDEEHPVREFGSSDAIATVEVNKSIHQKKIAIIDDEPHVVALVRKYLRDVGYENFVTVTDSSLAMTTLRSEKPDLVLLDIRMPNVNGLDILKEIREDRLLHSIPVLVFMSATDMDTKVASLELGANDYCEKPLHFGELQIRVRNNLMAKAHVDSLNDYSSLLESQVTLRTKELAETRREAIQCLARAAEMRDDNTGQHTIRVGRYAAIIAKELGFGNDRIVWLEHAAQLHDVGKIGVPDCILLKPGSLTKDEFATMQQHCSFGSRIIRNHRVSQEIGDRELGSSDVMSKENFHSHLMQMAAVVAETHHERWDGTGYPNKLKGEEIPIEGRITAVADVFDALSTARPYKKAMPLEQCFTILSENRGTHFDPTILDAFFRCKSEVIRTFHEYSDRDTSVAAPE